MVADADTDLGTIRDDLLAEQAALDAIVAPLATEAWERATPSRRWNVADQIAHLADIDRAAAVAITDPEAFAELRCRFHEAVEAGPQAVDDFSVHRARELTPDALLEAWRTDRSVLAEASRALAEGDRLPWFGPSMGARSFLTARLMECWAHGQDIVDAVGAERPATDRLRHIARLGVLTRGWSYRIRRLPPSDEPVEVRLRAPSGAEWRLGDPGAAARIEGAAVDFCLVVVQRRHPDDTGLRLTGPAAREWMDLAQAFAGPPTGPRPRQT